MHVEYMLRTTPDPSGDDAGARLVQRRYRDFDSLHASLTPFARRAKIVMPALPKVALSLTRNITDEFATERQALLQAWLVKVVQRPPLWSEPLRTFLGLASEDEGGGASSALAVSTAVVPSGSMEQQSAELKWIVARAQQPECGVLTESTGFFRGSTLVRWLLVQALAGSREQALPLAEAMRRQGLVEAVGRDQGQAFVDGSAQYRFVQCE